MKKVPIKKLNAMPNPTIYQRDDGTCWIKLNAQWQVPVTREPGGQFVGNGMIAKVNPNEMVEIVSNGAAKEGGGKSIPKAMWDKFGAKS